MTSHRPIRAYLVNMLGSFAVVIFIFIILFFYILSFLHCFYLVYINNVYFNVPVKPPITFPRKKSDQIKPQFQLIFI